jgi:spore germination protein
MIIHVVKEGETIQSIADSYGLSAERIILENELQNRTRLAVGEALVILFPDQTYTVKEGDTLGTIADSFGISLIQLLRNNPYLSDREYIYPGETIVISYKESKTYSLSVNGYIYPFVNRNVLKKTLPFLTYLSVFNYEVTAEGDIINQDDNDIIRMAKAYGVAPIMILTISVRDPAEEAKLIHTILTDEAIQDRLLDNLVNLLKEKDYYGVNIHTPYILPEDRAMYDDFIKKFTSRISKEGFKVWSTFIIRIFELLTGTLLSGINYQALGEEAVKISLISYEFGYSVGIPQGAFSMDIIRRFLEFTLKLFSPEKTLYGIRTIGYVWKLPYIPGETKGMAVSYQAAIQLALNNNAVIMYDEITNAAYFEYISENDQYEVQFWDARSIDNFVRLVPEFKMDGASVWNVMSFFPQMWLVINSQYDIKRVL